MLGVSVFQKFAGPDFFNGAKHFNQQHAMMRYNGTSALADDIGVWHLLGVANVSNVIDHIVSILLQGVIR